MKSFKLLLFGIMAIVGIATTSAVIAPMIDFEIGSVAIAISSMALIYGLSAPKVAMFDVIPGVQAAQLFTQKLIALFRDETPVKGFLRSMFKSEFSPTKFVSIGVKRGTELVAADVHRYSDGNRNKSTISSLKTFLPPYFHEFLDASDHELYDAMVTAIATGDLTFFSQMTREMALDFVELRKKIERAIELQCAQVLQTGVITLTSGDDIDFKRKSASIVAYNSSNDFSDNAVDPSEVLLEGCEFLRTKGKASGAIFDAILGDEVLMALLNNTKFQAKNDLKKIDLDTIFPPNMMPEGMAAHGVMSVGSYKVRLWTYPETYETTPGTSVKYIDTKKLILLPQNPNFKLAYAAVPQLIMNGRIPQVGEYLIQEEFKEIEGIHRLHIKCAPIPIPVAVDQIWTATILTA